MLEIFQNPIKVKELRSQIADLQNSVSILIGNATETTSKGNPYRDYKSAISALSSKYEGTAEWGVPQVKNIIDIRSAFIIGQGINIACDDPEARELEFIKDFVKLNNLDEEMPQELAKEAEIEGRSLVKLIPNEEERNIDVRFLSYTSKGYKINTEPDDYQKYTEAVYLNSGSQVIIPSNEFVYKKFSGRADKVNDIMPKTAMILKQCEDLDKALYDWRQANYYFGVPTPYFKCVDKNEVDATYQKMQKSNWKVGKAYVGTADFKMVEISGSGLNSIKEEIIMLAKIISGGTGVPVHFLGLPDLMTNRAVSTDLFEFINASTNKERHVWEGFYEELFDKALLMANDKFKFGFRTGLVKAKINTITEAQIRQLVEIWLPLYTSGVVTLDYILSKVPDINIEEVKKSQEESSIKMLEALKRQEKEPEPELEEENL